MPCLSLPNNYFRQCHTPYSSRFLVQTSYTIIYAVRFVHFLYWYSKVTSHMRGFFCTLRPQNRTPPPLKKQKEDRRRQIKLDLVIAHQGQCSHQVSLNLANLDFQGLTRFLLNSRDPLQWRCLNKDLVVVLSSLHTNRNKLKASEHWPRIIVILLARMISADDLLQTSYQDILANDMIILT